LRDESRTWSPWYRRLHILALVSVPQYLSGKKKICSDRNPLAATQDTTACSEVFPLPVLA
jgi:hypothetical protein